MRGRSGKVGANRALRLLFWQIHNKIAGYTVCSLLALASCLGRNRKRALDERLKSARRIAILTVGCNLKRLQLVVERNKKDRCIN